MHIGAGSKPLLESSNGTYVSLGRLERTVELKCPVLYITLKVLPFTLSREQSIMKSAVGVCTYNTPRNNPSLYSDIKDLHLCVITYNESPPFTENFRPEQNPHCASLVLNQGSNNSDGY